MGNGREEEKVMFTVVSVSSVPCTNPAAVGNINNFSKISLVIYRTTL